MTKTELDKSNRQLLVVPLSILLLLLIGTFISIIQVQRSANIRSKAESTTPTITMQSCTVESSLLATSEKEQRVFNKINEYRVQHDRPALIWSPELKNAAAWMSNDMLVHQKLSHTDSLGRDVKTRLANCGIPDFNSVAENIDSGSSDPDLIAKTWQSSPPHNANVLNPALTHAAVSLVSNASGSQSYWTMNLSGTSPTTTLSPTTGISVTPLLTVTRAPTTSINPTVTTYPTVTKLPTVTRGPTIVKKPTSTPVPTRPFTPTNTPVPATPTMDPGYIPNLLDTQIFISVKVPAIGKGGGTGSNIAPRHLTRKVDVQLFDMENQEVTIGHGFVRFDGDLFRGIIHLGVVPNDTYYIKVMSENLLTGLIMPEFQKIRNDRLNVLPAVTLVQGDVDANNSLDITDYNIAVACFQVKRCETSNLIDFNDDNKSNVYDYNILLHNYWQYEGD